MKKRWFIVLYKVEHINDSSFFDSNILIKHRSAEMKTSYYELRMRWNFINSGDNSSDQCCVNAGFGVKECEECKFQDFLESFESFLVLFTT